MQFASFCLITLVILMKYKNCIPISLSHKLSPFSPSYPSQTPFNFTVQTVIWTNTNDSLGSYRFSTNAFTTSEHSGTHLDAPVHFYNNSWAVDQIPLERLVGIRAIIFNVSEKCAQDSNYRIGTSDIDSTVLDRAKSFFVVLFYTGWSEFWPDQETYAGGNSQSELTFPGVSIVLAQFLVDRYANKLVGIGVDTLSIDNGPSTDFPAHRIFLKHNVYALENVATLDQVLLFLGNSSSFFDIDILPMNIGGGSGAPCRIVAYINNRSLENIANRLFIGFTNSIFVCWITCFAYLLTIY